VEAGAGLLFWWWVQHRKVGWDAVSLRLVSGALAQLPKAHLEFCRPFECEEHLLVLLSAIMYNNSSVPISAIIL
jgi:hypothetical protein